MSAQIRNFGLLTALACLGACTGMSEQACVAADWRTIGFEDGVAGRTVGNIGTYRQSCGKHGVAPDLETYRAGHAEGVQIYCRAGNGFDVGHRGASYNGVCPSDLEPDFLAAYESGRHLYELESALRQVTNQIAANEREQQSIKRELTEIAALMVSNDTTGEQRVGFVARAAELGERFSKITAENKTLEQDRVALAIELDEYQQTLAAEL
jgi:hypothetical protein